MTPAERWAASTAGGLAAGARWPCGWTLVAAALCIARADPASTRGVLITGLSSLAALLAAYVALRLEIDRTLFATLATATDDADAVLGELDAGLIGVFGATPPGVIRPLPERIAGLRRWAVRAVAIALLQTVLLTLALFFWTSI